MVEQKSVENSQKHPTYEQFFGGFSSAASAEGDLCTYLWKELQVRAPGAGRSAVVADCV